MLEFRPYRSGTAARSEAWSVPNTEVRGSVLRSLKQGLMDLGVNFLIARGYTGQTTEQLAPSSFASLVGVPLRSYVSASFTYHFRHDRATAP